MTQTLFTETHTVLTPVSQEDRRALGALPRTAQEHDAALAATPCMTQVRVGGTAAHNFLAFPLTVAAWNLERCLFPEDSAAMLAREGASLVLLSEMDNGMARTAQRDTTGVIAAQLGMSFAYGVEFLELSLGGAIEKARATDPENVLGHHGNAVLATVPLERPVLIRLDRDDRWFRFDPAGEQDRIGGRVAIAARVQTEAGPILAVSTHLESNALEDFRVGQMTALLDAIDTLAGDMPVILGGDMNTGNKMPDADWRTETLFGLAQDRGYEIHGGEAEAFTTRPSLITTAPPRRMKLDWFFIRGMDVAGSRIVPALRDDGTPLSDHELMICEIRGPYRT